MQTCKLAVSAGVISHGKAVSTQLFSYLHLDRRNWASPSSSVAGSVRLILPLCGVSLGRIRILKEGSKLTSPQLGGLERKCNTR